VTMTLLALALLGFSADDSTIALFDGRTLDGWVAEGVSSYQKDGVDTPVWTVEDGRIVCRGSGFGFLRYKEREFGDFTFRVEFRMAPKCNSGIGVRTRDFRPEDSRGTRPSYYSYEIQLTDDSGQAPTKTSSGSLYRYVAPRENALKPPGEWNNLEVTCKGPRIQVVLNGVLIQDVDQSEHEELRSKPLRGHVCLQNHGGHIEFRTVEIHELGPDAE